ncbi:MAG: chemotaxis protein CheC [Candidatus Omnitrophica bacterium]|nr:chemotaxis protein CheC [Candidatus Omnitrophota bacterium]
MAGERRLTQPDIIREVGSICAGNSTQAFSQMIKRSVVLEAPSLDSIAVRDIARNYRINDAMVIGVHCQMLAGISGFVSLVFEEKTAYDFASLFRSKAGESCGFLTEMGISSIKEIGNIVVSAYSNTMSVLLRKSVIPSIPVLTSGMLSDVMSYGVKPADFQQQVYVHTMTFRAMSSRLSGSFLLILSPHACREITAVMCAELRSLHAARQSLRKMNHG